MRDTFAGRFGTTCRLGEDERPLQHCLRVESEAAGRHARDSAYGQSLGNIGFKLLRMPGDARFAGSVKATVSFAR